jgi:hypothetical protein
MPRAQFAAGWRSFSKSIFQETTGKTGCPTPEAKIGY